MRARTGLWEPWVGNDPGPPGLRRLANGSEFQNTVRAQGFLRAATIGMRAAWVAGNRPASRAGAIKIQIGDRDAFGARVLSLFAEVSARRWLHLTGMMALIHIGGRLLASTAKKKRIGRKQRCQQRVHAAAAVLVGAVRCLKDRGVV